MKKLAVVRIFEEVTDNLRRSRLLVYVFDQTGNRLNDDEHDADSLTIPSTVDSASKWMNAVEEIRQEGYTVCLIDEIQSNII